MKTSEPYICRYPTGLQTDRVDCTSDDERTKLHVEEYIAVPMDSKTGLAFIGIRQGTVEVSGCVITDPSSPIGFESLSVRTFSGKDIDRNWDRALACARRLCDEHIFA